VILQQLRRIAQTEEERILSEVCTALNLPPEDDDMALEVETLAEGFNLVAACKQCGRRIRIACLPYAEKERWNAIVARSFSEFHEQWARHMASHAILRRLGLMQDQKA